MAKKLRRPSKVPDRITITWNICASSDDEAMSQYMLFKALERKEHLPVMMQALYQCETNSLSAQEVLDNFSFDGLLTVEDLPDLSS